jgi:hypothetical protein
MNRDRILIENISKNLTVRIMSSQKIHFATMVEDPKKKEVLFQTY